MATKTKVELKSVFGDLSSVMFQKEVIDLSNATPAIAPDFDLPVEVDTLSVSQGDPNINHYKIIGLSGDYFSTSEIGDPNIEFVVPTKNTDVLKLAFGEDAVGSITGATLDSVTYEGDSLFTTKKHKVTGSLVLVDANKENILIISNAVLYATPQYTDAGTKPFAVKFTGGWEATDKPDMAFLKKTAIGV